MHVCVHNLAREASFASGAKPFNRSMSRRSSQTFSSLNDPPRSAPLLLLLIGAVPWSIFRYPCASRIYQTCVRGLILCVCIGLAVHLIMDELYTGFSYSVLGLVPIPLGAAVAFVSIGFNHGCDIMSETFDLLAAVANDRGFHGWHRRHMNLPGVVYTGLWLCCWASAWLGSPGDQRHGIPLVLCCGLILTLSFVMACICRSLNTMIDSFCCDSVDRLPISEISHVWNLTQAVVRRCSEGIEHCFLSLILVVSVSLPLTLVGIVWSQHVVGIDSGYQAIVAGLPSFFVACGILYVVVSAAKVSEKCGRVPALINAISFGPGTERPRQHVVDYITSSAAGFYVYGMRVTTAMVCKFAYGWTVVGIGVCTRIFTGEA